MLRLKSLSDCGAIKRLNLYTIIIIIMLVIKLAFIFQYKIILLSRAGYPAIHKLSLRLAQTDLILI